MVEFNVEKHEYKVNDEVVPSVTEILSCIGGYADISPEILRQAKERGTAVHELTEFMDYGFSLDELEIPYDYIGYAIAYENFLKDYAPKWEGIEFIVASDIDGTKYAGTVDRCGKLMGENAIVDIKTYASPSREQYLSLCEQTEAYGKAVYGSADYKRYGLFLKKDGKYRIVDCDEYQEKFGVSQGDIFRKALKLYGEIHEAIDKSKGRKKDDKTKV